jgi:hypothetical protein
MRIGFLKIMVISFTVGISLGTSNSFASFTGELQTQFFQYSSEQNPTFFLNGKTQIETGRFQTTLHTYYESSTRGTWSIDPDPLRFDFHLSEKKKTFLWFGREQPLNLVRSEKVKATDAIGTVWTQNQLNALDPRVAGWLGMGLHQKISENTTLLFAYSPFFIPTLSPSLGFNESGGLNPKRYSRLPPSDVNTGGATLPIRYQLELGQISDLVLQPQFFAAIARKTEAIEVDASWFSAPKPNAVPLTSAKLAVAPNAVTAKVEIEPQFPREQWATLHLRLRKVPFTPTVEWAQGIHRWTQQFASFSGTAEWGSSASLNFGLLGHFADDSEDPRFSDTLAFVRIPWSITDRLQLRNLIQTTLLQGKKSFYWLGEFEMRLKNGLSLLLNARMLAGDDYSWFGDWRAEDSAGIGMRWSW